VENIVLTASSRACCSSFDDHPPRRHRRSLSAALKAVAETMNEYKEMLLQEFGKSLRKQRVHDLQVRAR
jgi:hypothetical protein